MKEIEKKIKFELFCLSFLPMTLPYLANRIWQIYLNLYGSVSATLNLKHTVPIRSLNFCCWGGGINFPTCSDVVPVSRDIKRLVQLNVIKITGTQSCHQIFGSESATLLRAAFYGNFFLFGLVLTFTFTVIFYVL